MVSWKYDPKLLDIHKKCKQLIFHQNVQHVHPKYGLFSQEIVALGPNNLSGHPASGSTRGSRGLPKSMAQHEPWVAWVRSKGCRTVFFVERGRSMGLMGLMVDHVDICWCCFFLSKAVFGFLGMGNNVEGMMGVWWGWLLISKGTSKWEEHVLQLEWSWHPNVKIS